MENRKFKIGDRVLYENSEHVIVAYNSNNRTTYAIHKISGGYSHYASEEELTLIENKMEKGVVKLSIDDAKKLYEQGGNFRTIALGAYPEEELTYIPKDGDFITSSSGCPFIYKDFKDNSHKTHYGCYLGKYVGDYGVSIVDSTGWTTKKGCRPSTEEEKQLLLSELHKIGKDWDPINKEVIPYRWRAKKGEKYYYVLTPSGYSSEIIESYESHCEIDDRRFANCNYFRTRKEAQEIADKVNNVFMKL